MLSKISIQKLRGYGRKKQRLADGRCLVEGWRSLEAALTAGVAIEWLLEREAGEDASEVDGRLLARLRDRAVRVDTVSEAQMRQVAHSVTPPALAALVSWSPMEARDLVESILAAPDGIGTGQRQLVVVADGVGEPGNLGAIIRTADWFGAVGLFAGPGSVELTNPKVVQATMGSLFHLPIGSGGSSVELIERLQAGGFSVASLELDGAIDLREVSWSEKLALVVGNEAHGVSGEVCAVADLRVAIPRFGKAESLNAAASVAVVLGQVRLN